MLGLFGRDEVIRNVFRISALVAPEAPPRTLPELRKRYLDFLQTRQPSIQVNRAEYVFVDDPGLERSLSSAFGNADLNDLNQQDVVGDAYDLPTAIAKRNLARDALSSLAEFDEDFATIFGLVIHSVFVRPSRPVAGATGSHGGSSSASIGSIWLSVHHGTRPIDLMEMFVHELTHHLIFIDELNRPQFNYGLIADAQNFAHSAILRKHRPLDKVIHSIIVATEILLARRRFLPEVGATTIHPATAPLVAEVRSSIRSVLSLENIDALISPHVRHLIAACAKACDEEAT